MSALFSSATNRTTDRLGTSTGSAENEDVLQGVEAGIRRPVLRAIQRPGSEGRSSAAATTLVTTPTH